MKTDWDRLERVRAGISSGRGCGKTFSECHYAADWLVDQSISGKEKLAVWMLAGTSEQGFKYIFRILAGILEERAADFSVARDYRTITCGSNKLRFIVIEQDSYALRGLEIYKTFRDHWF